MPLKYTIKHYPIKAELTPKQFDNLLKLDYLDLSNSLGQIGVYHIDYDGHYGNFLFFDVKTLDNIDDILYSIEKLLED